MVYINFGLKLYEHILRYIILSPRKRCTFTIREFEIALPGFSLGCGLVCNRRL